MPTLGGDVEKKMGTLKLLNITLATAALSGVGQFLMNGPNFGGLSGVVYGLLGYVITDIHTYTTSFPISVFSNYCVPFN